MTTDPERVEDIADEISDQQHAERRQRRDITRR